MSTAEALAQRQLDAYNAHDLEAFVACYADEVEVRTFPGAGPPDFTGHGALRSRYGPLFEKGTIQAELLTRITIGKTSIDHERVTGLGEDRVVFAVAIYEVGDERIQKVWFIRGD
ncbi:MAG: nuclear transport factor 2 family protein [Planctomycetes bacterium]|nr:nuclear transport factor 2 family protein [Planctomycetota bacterium]